MGEICFHTFYVKCNVSGLQEDAFIPKKRERKSSGNLALMLFLLDSGIIDVPCDCDCNTVDQVDLTPKLVGYSNHYKLYRAFIEGKLFIR